MYLPEYTITNKILNHVATFEYVQAIAETKVILPSWRKKLQKEATVNFYKKNLNLLGIEVDIQEIKKFTDGIAKNPAELLKNIKMSIEKVQNLGQGLETGEENLQELHAILTGQMHNEAQPQIYRQTKTTETSTSPEEILAEIVELMDWLNSLDGQETHPLIGAGIVKARIIQIRPYQNYNELMGNLLSWQILHASNNTLQGFMHPEMAYMNDPAGYRQARGALQRQILQNKEENDLTDWLTFYLGTIAREAGTKKEEILLLSKDTKIAKASGRAKLSKRQEKIVAYLQDYGMLQNKDFPKIFPQISEDTVLRELKKLIKKDIVVKRGKTKSSRYELK